MFRFDSFDLTGTLGRANGSKRRRAARKTHVQANRHPSRRRLLEALEQRIVLTSQFTVVSTDLVASSQPVVIAPTEGVDLNGTLATFTGSDPNGTTADFSAQIDWGDGATTIGRVSGTAAAGYSVNGSYIYSEEATAAPLAIVIADSVGDQTTISNPANVADASLTALPMTVAATEGFVFAGNVAAFVDANPAAAAGNFATTIDWGDGQTSPGSVTTPGSSLDMVSQPGDYIGGGATYHFTSSTGGFTVGSAADDSQVTFTYEEPNFSHFWSVEFAAPSGDTLVPGTYVNAARAAFHPPSQPGLDVNGDGRGSNTLTGSFVIRDAVYDASGNVLYFDATFVQHSEGMPPALTGEIRYISPRVPFAVSGTHEYTEEGAQAITVTMVDTGGSKATTASKADVTDAPLSASGETLVATRGAAFNGTVATFTDANAAADATDYTATIDWGDGTTSTPGTVVAGAGGGFDVSGSHIYTQKITRSVAVVIDDVGGATAAVTSTAVFTLVGATSAVAIAPTEGAGFSGTVATFTGIDPNGSAADFTASIVWGDGSTTSGSVSGTARGGYSVNGAHVYSDEATAVPLSIVVADRVGNLTTITSAANVADATLTAVQLFVAATEGIAFTGNVATFADANPAATAGDFTATIAWGDGRNSPGTVTAATGGGFAVYGTHVYADEASYLGVVVAINDIGGSTATASNANTAVNMITVADATLTALPMTIAATECIAFTGNVAAFADANPAAPAGNFTTTIDWGDGQTSPGTVTASGSSLDMVSQPGDYIGGGATYNFTSSTGAFSVSSAPDDSQVTFAYEEPNLTQYWYVEFAAPSGETLVPGTYVNAVRAAFRPPSQPGLDVFGDSRGSNTLTGSFVIRDAVYDASGNVLYFDATFVQHSEGVPPALTGEICYVSPGVPFAVSGTHEYTEEGAQAITVTMVDTGGSKATTASKADVTDAPLSAAGETLVATVGAAFNGTVATFTDANAAAAVTDFTATIDWGDGTTSTPGTVVAGAGGGFDVSGSHIYTQKITRSVAVVIDDVGGATAAVTSTAVFTDLVGATSAVAIAPTEGAGFSGTVATFTGIDPNGSAADFTASIVWGDGSTTSGSVSGTARGGYSVNGAHVYSDEATAVPLSIVVADRVGNLTTISSATNIADATLTAVPLSVAATEGIAIKGNVATFADANSAATAGDFTATIAWGDGENSPGTVSAAAGGGFAVYGTHVYADEANYVGVVVAINDIGGSAAMASNANTAVNMVTVADTTLTAQPLTVAATEGIAFTGNLAIFADANPGATAGDFTATIAWGDGQTSPGTVSAAASGGFAVYGTHVYADEANYVGVVVAINDTGGDTATAFNANTAVNMVTVADATLTAMPATVVTSQGATFSGVVATFTDANPLATVADFTATINWGDGHTGDGTVSAATGGGFQLTGSHQYTGFGAFAIGVSLADSGGASAPVNVQATFKPLPHEAYVIAVYLDVLARLPDAAGLAYWAGLIDAGTAISSVAEAIGQSNEYYAGFVIKPDYVKLLGRAADDAGVAYWTQLLQNGLTDQELEAGLIASDEFYAKAGENFDPGPDADDTSIANLDYSTDWIDAVYTLLLGRTADSGGETHWNGQLTAGVSRSDVALLIANSAENDMQLINDDYFHYLGRAADPDGLTFWQQQFADGKTNEDVIAGFTGSAEYYTEHTV